MRATFFLLALLIGLAVSATVERSEEKRGFKEVLESIRQKAADLLKKVKDRVTLSFHDAIDKLKNFVSADETVAKCTAFCTNNAAKVFGSGEESIKVACGPLCEGALALANEKIGK